jgi:hypothetical protein
MNRLSAYDRAKSLQLPCEAMSIRAVTRITGFSKTTISKLVVDAAKRQLGIRTACFKASPASGSRSTRFGASWERRQRMPIPPRRPLVRLATHGCGLRRMPIPKLVPCWHVGTRDGDAAMEFIDDLASRLANRVQLTTDGHKAYLYAVDAAFGGEVDFAQLVKLYGATPESAKGRYSPAECTGIIKTRVIGDPDLKHVSTSYAERNTLDELVGLCWTPQIVH